VDDIILQGIVYHRLKGLKKYRTTLSRSKILENLNTSWD